MGLVAMRDEVCGGEEDIVVADTMLVLATDVDTTDGETVLNVTEG